MNVTVATLGFPRIGPRRELKFALEKFWAGKSSGADLLDAASALRAAAWARQHALGVDWLRDDQVVRHQLPLHGS